MARDTEPGAGVVEEALPTGGELQGVHRGDFYDRWAEFYYFRKGIFNKRKNAEGEKNNMCKPKEERRKETEPRITGRGYAADTPAPAFSGAAGLQRT